MVNFVLCIFTIIKKKDFKIKEVRDRHTQCERERRRASCLMHKALPGYLLFPFMSLSDFITP